MSGTDHDADLRGRFGLDGKTAIVTGASSGIGARIATAFAAAGATVYAVARRADRLATLAAQHPGVEPWPADLSDDDECGQVVSGVVERAGRVDILVNNAGIANIERAEDETTETFRRLVETNLVATFVLAREAGKAMIAQGDGGAIVNISSTAGLVGVGRGLPQAAYAASKAGGINLTRELATQWARHGIRVERDRAGMGRHRDDHGVARHRSGAGDRETAHTARPRRARRRIASAALFLASDASSFITGAVLAVDGGWTAV